MGAATRTGEVTDSVPQPWDDPDHWTSVVEWWTHPALAYLAGLHDGGRLERERIAAEDEQLHRAVVRSAIATIERVDRRRLADAGAAA
jgi:hypothetical protein